MQDTFRCEVAFYVGGVFEYASHDDLLQLESRLIDALLTVLPRVSISGLDFKDIRPIPVFDSQDAGDKPPHDPVGAQTTAAHSVVPPMPCATA